MTNEDQEEFWSKSAGPAWVSLQGALDALMQPVLDLVLTRADLAPGNRVLDIGCGTGISVAQAADRVGATGHVTGLDISDTMLAMATSRLSARANTALIRADAQVHDFEDAMFDALISRFGVMFFEDSVAAFANISHGLTAGARMTFAAWGPAAQNPFFMEPAAAATDYFGPMPKVDRTLPGPFAFEDTDRVARMIEAAGLVDITAQTVNLFLTPAGDLAALAELCCQVGPGDAALQFHNGTAEDRTALQAAIMTRFSIYDGPDGPRIPAAINLYQARTSA